MQQREVRVTVGTRRTTHQSLQEHVLVTWAAKIGAASSVRPHARCPNGCDLPASADFASEREVLQPEWLDQRIGDGVAGPRRLQGGQLARAATRDGSSTTERQSSACSSIRLVSVRAPLAPVPPLRARNDREWSRSEEKFECQPPKFWLSAEGVTATTNFFPFFLLIGLGSSRHILSPRPFRRSRPRVEGRETEK